MAMMVYRGGPGSPSAAEVRVEKSGTIKLITGLMDVGEGATTVLPQIAAEVLGAEFEQIEPVFGDTTGTPDAPITAGSTATFSTGTAVVQAAEEVRQRLLELASSGLEAPVRELDAALGYVFVKSDPSRRMSLTQVAGSMEGEANRTVREARIALGGVAPVPYRAMDAEAFLAGWELASLDPADVASLVLPNPTPLPQNAYKIPMAPTIAQRAIGQLII